ncbi:MAG: metallophosphoesterase [Ruminococcus sp.]|nr:metallophosphoesterase [Ruminococcus sp.]
MSNYSYESFKDGKFKIFEYETTVAKETGKKFLVISDLHIFSDKDVRIIEDLMENLKGLKYDAIIIAGDIIDSTNVLDMNDYVTGKLLEFISFLGNIAPTYIAYASHDLGYYYYTKDKNIYPWLPDIETFNKKFLNQVASYHNISVQESEVQDLGDGYKIGVLNPSLEYAMRYPDGDFDVLSKEMDRYSFIKDFNSSDVNTLVCHYPNVIFDLQNLGLLNNVDLAVSGPNHSGVMQFKYIPVEFVFNLVRARNRGLITPGKKLFPKDIRGVVELNDRANLVINPAIKTFAACTGSLEKLDGLFYRGMTEINYVPEDNLSLTRSKK